MEPIHRFFLTLWILLRHMRPVSTGRLLMPAVFLSAWTILTAFGLAAPVAFVWSAVLAQAIHLWAVLPVSVWHQRRLTGSAGETVTVVVSVVVVLFGMQIWTADPLVSQRLLSLACCFYVAVTAMGLCGDTLILDRMAPVSEDSDVPLEFRRHLLRLYALVAVLVLVVNEALIAADATLALRVVTLSLLPPVLHVFFETSLFLTCPRLDEERH